MCVRVSCNQGQFAKLKLDAGQLVTCVKPEQQPDCAPEDHKVHLRVIEDVRTSLSRPLRFATNALHQFSQRTDVAEFY